MKTTALFEKFLIHKVEWFFIVLKWCVCVCVHARREIDENFYNNHNNNNKKNEIMAFLVFMKSAKIYDVKSVASSL